MVARGRVWYTGDCLIVKEEPYLKNLYMPLPSNPAFSLKQNRLIEFKDKNYIKPNIVLAVVWRID